MFSLNPPWIAFKTPMYKKKNFNLPPKTLRVQSEKAWSEERKQDSQNESGHHRSIEVFTKQASLFEDEKVGLRVVGWPATLTRFVPAPGAQSSAASGLPHPLGLRKEEGG